MSFKDRSKFPHCLLLEIYHPFRLGNTLQYIPSPQGSPRHVLLHFGFPRWWMLRMWFLTLTTEAVGSAETFVSTYISTWCLYVCATCTKCMTVSYTHGRAHIKKMAGRRHNRNPPLKKPAVVNAVICRRQSRNIQHRRYPTESCA